MVKTLFVSLFLSALALPALAQPQPYEVDTTRSRIGFSGTHAGTPFTGAFQTWSAEILFDAETPQNSSLTATIDTASARTGNRMYDGTLPTADWFDVATHPTATFASTAIRHKEGDIYTIDGVLTVRNTPVDVSFDVALPREQLEAGLVETMFTLTVQRLAFGMGAKSDGRAEWVSDDIGLEIVLSAKRKTP
jgi:cytochrome b561